MTTETRQTGDNGGAATSGETLTVTDNRTGKSYEIPIEDNTIRATELRKIKTTDDDFGLMTYDPAFMATASCRSAVTFIDGERGILEYRGYPIEQLAEKSSYLEVAYLLINGELPRASQLNEWDQEITIHTFVHENIKEFMQGFRYDAHPMGMLLASVGALSTFYPEASAIKDQKSRYMQMIRLLAKMPTLAAFSYRHNRGMPYVYPDNDLSYPGNFLSMIYKVAELKYEPDPRLERALDVLFILHADHEQNCSTSAVRSVGSSQVDPYSSVAAGVAALYGPLHGGANEAVLRMLRRIETKENIPDFIAGVKNGDEKLMGFGHRVYKNFDPRAKIIKKTCRRGVRGHGEEPAVGDRHRAREDRPRGRLLHLAQAVPERRLLLRTDLRGAGDARGDVPGAVRDRAHEWLDRPVARDDRRSRAEDRPSASDLYGRARAGLPADRSARLSRANARWARRPRRSPSRGGLRPSDHSHSTNTGSHLLSMTWRSLTPIYRSRFGRSGRMTARVSGHRTRACPRESRYRRFLSAKPTLTESDARYLVEVDGRDHVALVATAAVAGTDGEIVAVARFVRLADAPDTAEFAIVVADNHQRRGLATELLRRLAEAATERDITRFRASMLSDNIAIQRILERLAVGEVSCLRKGSITEMEIALPGGVQRGDRPAQDTTVAARRDTETRAAA